MESYQVKVVEEASALEDRLCKLFGSMFTDNFKAMPPHPQRLLVAQFECMRTYYKILQQRIALFEAA